jgi:hypothetical protein
MSAPANPPRISPAPASAPAPGQAAAPAAGAEAPRPIEHPARADDRDHGRVALGYEGYSFPVWVLVPWILFLIWGATYLTLYLLPGGSPAAP